MIAAFVARAMADRGIHYGWLMAGLVFLAGLCESAAMSVPSVLLTPMSIDLGWSISELSGPLGLRVALFGLVAPFAGGLILLDGPARRADGLGGAFDRWPSPRHHDECEVGIMAGPRRPHGHRAWPDRDCDGGDDRDALVHRPVGRDGFRLARFASSRPCFFLVFCATGRGRRRSRPQDRTPTAAPGPTPSGERRMRVSARKQGN